MEEEQYILFLKGVSLKDFVDIDELFDEKLNETTHTQYKKIIYDKIPKIFKNVKTWTTTTNIKCWHCELSFNNPPVFIPNEIYNTSTGKEISVCGNFCSFGCAKSFLDYNKSKPDNWDKNEMLKLLFYLFNAKKIDDIKPAPSKYILTKYGGSTTIKDYQAKLKEVYNANLNN